MVKNPRRTSETRSKNAYVGAGIVFVIIWPILVTMFTQAGGLDGLTIGKDTESVSVIVFTLLLVPIAAVIFPLLYRMGNIYSLNEKRDASPVWQRVFMATFGTIIALGIVYYLFIVIGFVLFYRF
jgi:RsiW-degrading membrane proteinase PrsW (M82 family)